MRSTFGSILRTVLFLVMPAAVGLFVLGVPLIMVLLQRGEFTANSTQMVAYALRFYALGLVAHSVVEITVRAFYALHDTLTPVAVGIGAMVMNILLSLWWVRPLSYGGLALANSIATTVEMVILLWLLARAMQGIDGPRLARSVLRNGGAAAVMGLALWAWMTYAALDSAWPVLLGGLGVAVLVYAGAAWLLRSRELMPAVDLIGRRLRR